MPQRTVADLVADFSEIGNIAESAEPGWHDGPRVGVVTRKAKQSRTRIEGKRAGTAESGVFTRTLTRHQGSCPIRNAKLL